MRVKLAERLTGYLAEWEKVFFIDSNRSYRFCLIIIILYLAIISVILFSSPYILIMDFYDDALTMLDGAWRAMCGQRSYTDFSSLYGVGYFSVIALGMKVGGICGRALIYGPAIVSIFLTLWAWFVAKSRLSSIMSLFFSLTVGSILIGNYALGIHDFRVSSYSMGYNRLGWSLFCVLLLQIVLPPRGSPSARRMLLEGISIGAILVALAFLKISYFFVGFLALLLIPICLKKAKFVWLGIAVALFPLSLFLSYLIKFNPGDFFRDMRNLAEINSSLNMFARVISLGIGNSGSIILVLFLFIILNLPIIKQNGDGVFGHFLSNLIVISAVILIGLALCAGNFQLYQIPFFGIGAALLAEDFLRRSVRFPRNDSAPLDNELRYFFACSLSVYLMAFIFLPDMGSVLSSLKKMPLYHRSGILERTEIESETMKDIRFLRKSTGFASPDQILPEITRELSEQSLPSVSTIINEGIRLLKKHATKESRILTMDYSNPFPFALGLPPPRGGMLVWNYGRTFNEFTFPPPEIVFKEASLIMMKARELNPPSPLNKIYLPYIQGRFKKMDESDSWVLYGK